VSQNYVFYGPKNTKWKQNLLELQFKNFFYQLQLNFTIKIFFQVKLVNIELKKNILDPSKKVSKSWRLRNAALADRRCCSLCFYLFYWKNWSAWVRHEDKYDVFAAKVHWMYNNLENCPLLTFATLSSADLKNLPVG